MQWTGPNQAVVEWDTSTANTIAGPVHTAVEGYGRYNDRVESLPVDEAIQLRVFTDYIVASFEPGCLPITGIHIVGHADTDAQKGKAFEQQISESRARNLLAYLKKEVERNATVNDRLVAGTPTATTIAWKPRGVGATQPNPENIKRGKKPSNMTEEDRKRERRVEIILEPGLTPVKEIPIEIFPQGIGGPNPGGSPKLPTPPPVTQPEKQREWLKDALGKDPIIRALPPFLRDKAIDAGKDLDETLAEKALDALPIDSTYKPAVQAAVKALLQALKGKKYEVPKPVPPQYQQPPSVMPAMPSAPGQVIIPGPTFKW